MNFAGLSHLMPDNFNFSGGFGLAGVLAMLFPYIQKIILHSFDFDILAYVEQFFAPDTFLGKLFNGNSALGAGAGIVSVGAIVALLQQVWNNFWTFYNNYFSMSLKIPSSDDSYCNVLEWMREHQRKYPKHLNLQTETKESLIGKWESVHDFIPSVEASKLTFQGKKIKVSRKREENNIDEYSNGQDNLIFSTTGSDTTLFRDMLAEVKKFKVVKKEGRTVIYTSRNGSHWQDCGSGKRKRPLESVILEDGIVETVLADIKEFRDTAHWYTEFGVSYRRGYLLHGPPGTGKTSFISAVAGHFDLNVCILNLSDKSHSDDSLNELLVNAPENSLLLLEDVDAAFASRDGSAGDENSNKKKKPGQDSTAFEGMNRLTFSGLLNALDGVASAEGRILFMTTNHLEKLDSALIRPGRVDMSQMIGYASESQVERMFRRFYKDAPAETAQRFVKEMFNTPDRPDISLAQLQGLFLRYKTNPAEVFSGLPLPRQNITMSCANQGTKRQGSKSSRGRSNLRGRRGGRGRNGQGS